MPSTVEPTASEGRDRARRVAARAARAAGVSVLTLAVMCGLWQGAIDLFHLSPFVAKGPVAV